MSTSTSQSGDVSIEVDEVKNDEPKLDNIDDTEDKKENGSHSDKYLAVSPEGDFLVELVLKDFDFELQMYEIKISNDKDDSKQKSYRELSKIHTPSKFTNGQINLSKFINEQINLSKDKDVHKNIIKWSVSVSDKSTSSSEFRLLAISYISLKDMEDYRNKFKKFHLMKIPNNGFTFVFIINIINNDYSISEFKDKELPIKFGGVVKFISKDEKDKQIIDKSSQNADTNTLIILTLSGIYKYQMKNKLIKNIQKLKYPKRVYNAMIHNINLIFNNLNDAEYKAYNFIHTFIKQCLNKHYFLVDTKNKDIEYMELYNLDTNQLVNNFQMQNLSGSYSLDSSPIYAISNNGKLLAYVFNKTIKIFSIECSLEIAKFELGADIPIGKDIPNEQLKFVNFFHNDEILLIFSTTKWFVWDIFSSLRDSIKLEDLGSIIELRLGFDENIKPSNSFMVVNKGNKLAIYDDLFIKMYLKDLKKDEEQIWKKLSGEDILKQDPNKNNNRDLQNKESKLDEYYHILEPWLLVEKRRYSNYSFYLDDKKEKLLLIGNHTIQVWHEQGPEEGPKKRSLEFIHVPLSHLPFNYEQSFREAMNSEQFFINVIDINYCLGKFKLNFQIDKIQIENIEDKSFKIKMPKLADKNDTENVVEYNIQIENEDKSFQIKMAEYNIQIENIEDKSFQIKMADKNDTMNVVKYACYSLKYLSSYKKFEFYFKDKKFADIIEQTQKLILIFIKLHPNEWRLLDIRYDLMSVLIEAKEYKLVKYILSSKEPLHIPLNIPWEDKKIISSVDNKEDEKKKKNNTIQTAFSDIDYNTIVNIRMVPLVNFTTTKKIFDIRENKYVAYLKDYISPFRFSSLKKEDYSPFIKLIESENKDNIREILYENPSMGAVMNWMWYCSKYYWYRFFYLFFLYFLAYSVICWAYIAHIQITGSFQRILLVIAIVLFYYLSYYHIAVEFKQFCHKGRKYYLDAFNLVDLLSLIIPIIIFSYILICYYSFDNGFKNAESSLLMTFIIFLSILILWYEFFLTLRMFEAIIAMGHALFTLLGYPFYIGLNQSPTTYEIAKGNNADITMTGEEPDNPFSNILGSIVAFAFVIILQNIIISYMSDAFSDAVKDSKRGLYRFQIDFIHDFSLLEKSLEFNNLDSMFKDKIRAKYICFFDYPNITSSWNDASDKMKEKPYPVTQFDNKTILKCWESLSKDGEFNWGEDEKVEEVETEVPKA
ncbi:transient receptor potential ion channel protein [Gigaspora margarita]|uniref:Transient receptor potential ion channel protein n=1 Tax=Gigaspora margarita TaxID=4874 RepID=A0A8H4AT64_GIGMA|nr:transient receptor potential ion channel protein [Gigaspora margarita]